MQAIAVMGDLVEAVMGRAPLTRSRLRSMTEDYPTPMEPTFALLGQPYYTFAEGIAATMAWLRTLPEFADEPQSM
jgi:nucleoside-diphosphate-sugar epimerase